MVNLKLIDLVNSAGSISEGWAEIAQGCFKASFPVEHWDEMRKRARKYQNAGAYRVSYKSNSNDTQKYLLFLQDNKDFINELIPILETYNSLQSEKKKILKENDIPEFYVNPDFSLYKGIASKYPALKQPFKELYSQLEDLLKRLKKIPLELPPCTTHLDVLIQVSRVIDMCPQAWLPQKKKRDSIDNKILSIDIETYSPVDLGKSGVYPYAEHPNFEILLFAYAFDDAPVKCVDIVQGEELPDEIKRALTDPTITKTAHNANFERVCIGQFFSMNLPINQWECTMVKSAMLGLPLALGVVAKILKLEQEKMAVGKTLIRYFSMPCKPTKSNGGRSRNLPKHDADKWDLFKSYCIQDVEVERAIRNKISFFQIPEQERQLYCLDQLINDRGVELDMQMVGNAIETDGIYNNKLSAEATGLTSLDNPNSVSQLKQWISEELGEKVESLSKETIPELLKSTFNEDVIKVLQIRQEMAKTSVKKYEAMKKAVCMDGRVRGLLQYYGATRNRTPLATGYISAYYNSLNFNTTEFAMINFQRFSSNFLAYSIDTNLIILFEIYNSFQDSFYM